MRKAAADPIAAAATPPGAGGIGIVRVSGGDVAAVARGILSSGELPPPRHAKREKFVAADGAILDDGVCLYFRAPHSFTGQDVLELHGHGGGAVLRGVLERCFQLGARAAEAGEFTMRAYCNGKMDLAQAEAVADLINAGSASAARAAANSLDGAFSRRAQTLAAELTKLRAELEAALDFADEDTGAPADFSARIGVLSRETEKFLAQCRQGAKLAEGITVAIVGAPNTGKSSLLNTLCGEDAAIVAAAAGTTRDLIVRDIAFGGVPARLLDTAGLRETAGEIEQEGIARAVRAAQNADLVLAVRDGEDAPQIDTSSAVLHIRNKIDLHNIAPGVRDGFVYVSAKTGAGIDDLRIAITAAAGGGADFGGGVSGADGGIIPSFTARARHLAALDESLRCFAEAQNAGMHAEIAAAWLSSAHGHIASLTGGTDDEKLLGEIFSRFCIGK
ncbi:MAG: tRNA uridine-5-carboxymethylaminomethyl(34) synthesis GTPase MnmE [Gammaproteobacteria bacterium]